MSSKLFICIILTAFRILQADAAVVFDNIYNSCGTPSDTAAGGAAILSDVINMGRAAGNFMDQRTSGQLSPWDCFRVQAMFDAVFDAKQPDAQARWDTVRANLQSMANIATTKENIWISCDDTTLFHADNSDKQYFIDPETKLLVDLASPVRLCSNPVVDNGVSKYLLGWQTTIQDVKYIFICKDNPQVQNTAVMLSQQKYTEGTDLYSMSTLSTTVFHELTHALPELNMVGDVSGGTAVGGERYGWVGMQEVRSTYSVRNPDSLMIFALALSMEEYLWDDGIAMTQATQFLLLQGNAEGQKIIEILGLPDPSSPLGIGPIGAPEYS